MVCGAITFPSLQSGSSGSRLVVFDLSSPTLSSLKRIDESVITLLSLELVCVSVDTKVSRLNTGSSQVDSRLFENLSSRFVSDHW